MAIHEKVLLKMRFEAKFIILDTTNISRRLIKEEERLGLKITPKKRKDTTGSIFCIRVNLVNESSQRNYQVKPSQQVESNLGRQTTSKYHHVFFYLGLIMKKCFIYKI